MSIFNRLKIKQAETLDQKKKAYWRLLDATDINKPTKQQAADLERMLGELEKSAEDAEEDHEYVKKLRGLEADAKLLHQRNKELEAHKQLVNDWVENLKRLEKERHLMDREKRANLRMAHERRGTAHRADRELREEGERNPELFSWLRIK